jgi:hypothetical protein
MLRLPRSKERDTTLCLRQPSNLQLSLAFPLAQLRQLILASFRWLQTSTRLVVNLMSLSNHKPKCLPASWRTFPQQRFRSHQRRQPVGFLSQS